MTDFIVVAGKIAVGKTTFARELCSQSGRKYFSVRNALAFAVSMEATNRRMMQSAGARLEEATSGSWLAAALPACIPGDHGEVVDSARTVAQIDGIKRSRPNVHVIYLDAPLEVREARYAMGAETDLLKARAAFSSAMRYPTESAVEAIKENSDLVVETEGLTTQEVVDQALGYLASHA